MLTKYGLVCFAFSSPQVDPYFLPAVRGKFLLSEFDLLYSPDVHASEHPNGHVISTRHISMAISGRSPRLLTDNVVPSSSCSCVVRSFTGALPDTIGHIQYMRPNLRDNDGLLFFYPVARPWSDVFPATACNVVCSSQ